MTKIIRFALAAVLSTAAIGVKAQPDTFFTQRYPYAFLHSMGTSLPLYNNDTATLQYLTRFDNIFAGNELPLGSTWVNTLHVSGSKLLFYEYFGGIHFVAGKNNPQPSETWKTDFLDNNKFSFWTINPLLPPAYSEFAPGRHFSSLPYAYDYFINYGKQEADEYLVNQYYNVKRPQWNYDGVFFDLMGSYWLNIAQIQDPNNSANWLNALQQYNFLSAQRTTPTLSYDENGAAFLQRLRAQNPDKAAFPIWGNQAYLSGNGTTGANPYYRHLNVDLLESSFTTWENSTGFKSGVRVNLDNVWYNNATPVETRIIPFDTGVAALQPVIQQATYALANYGNSVSGVVSNYVRPRYVPFEDGYKAEIDREAIYYNYAASKVTGIGAFAWDFFDTVSTATGLTTPTTGLPVQGYLRWAKDSIYFLDIGNTTQANYQTVNLGAGKKAVVRFFDRGFVIINASNPAADISVDLAGNPNLKTDPGIAGYRDHLSSSTMSAATPQFSIPAAYYALGNVKTNTARVYSYVKADGTLYGVASGVGDWELYCSPTTPVEASDLGHTRSDSHLRGSSVHASN